MEFFEINGRRYARFARLGRETGLRHAFSTRPIDVSAREDERAPRRDAARRAMAADLGLDPSSICYCVQVHDTRVAVIDGPPLDRRLEEYDALVTARKDVALMTFSADCPLVLLFDPRLGIVGMVHASWRCTVASATLALVRTMRERFGCDPAGLLAGIGPSAGPERYEVGQDVYDAASNLPEREQLFPRRDGRMYFDLWTANRVQLQRAGLAAENIEVAGICTMTDASTFYSFRREGAGCGHFGLMAGLTRGASDR
ncbi:MAG: laccase domain-containing protein [Phycisphaerae bacterium]|jgi:hypothetical protein